LQKHVRHANHAASTGHVSGTATQIGSAAAPGKVAGPSRASASHSPPADFPASRRGSPYGECETAPKMQGRFDSNASANEFFSAPRPMKDLGSKARNTPRKLEMTRMAILTIQCQPCTATTCALCGKVTKASTGPRLFLDDTGEVVCRDCGRRHAPDLTALLDLAAVAERVGRIGRHTIVPPMAALLDLARAAEQYAESKPHIFRHAA
jgi:hypothetical protein